MELEGSSTASEDELDLDVGATTAHHLDETVDRRPSQSRRSITPPQTNRKRQHDASCQEGSRKRQHTSTYVPSPIRLTRIKDLPNAMNEDTVTLHDLLGDPSIIECWQFNFLFNVDFLMSAFDESIRTKVMVKVVHGSWKKEDTNRLRAEAAIERWPNVQQVLAYMHEPYGTHHTKMMIIFRSNETAQIVITTANMISVDWTSLTQAVWQSPMLTRQSSAPKGEDDGEDETPNAPFGSGRRFKKDFLNYLRAYGEAKTGQLVESLRGYNFSSIKAALIGSTPIKQKALVDANRTLWGWPGLKDIIKHVNSCHSRDEQRPTIIAQVSSIATLGSTTTWLDNLLGCLAGPRSVMAPRPQFRVMFPSADEIRRSIGGYSSGGSIHTPVNTTPAQTKQLEYLRSKMVYWAGDGQHVPAPADAASSREAGRRRAAPHIKTYISFADDTLQSINWAMMTSANLSKQAWGELINKNGEVRIASWELGVIVWPELFEDDNPGTKATMVPTFGVDTPAAAASVFHEAHTAIGLRMPYDLPLVPYAPGERPWCNKVPHREPDWKGETWPPTV